MKNKILVLLSLLILYPFATGYLSEESQNVIVGNVETPVYNVEVSWDSMQFVYNEQINYEWDNNSHTYVLEESTYQWIVSNNNIKVENKSVVPINVRLNYISTRDNIDGNFNISSTTLNQGTSMNFELMLDGKMSNEDVNYTSIGTVNLLIF